MRRRAKILEEGRFAQRLLFDSGESVQLLVELGVPGQCTFPEGVIGLDDKLVVGNQRNE